MRRPASVIPRGERERAQRRGADSESVSQLPSQGQVSRPSTAPHPPQRSRLMPRPAAVADCVIELDAVAGARATGPSWRRSSRSGGRCCGTRARRRSRSGRGPRGRAGPSGSSTRTPSTRAQRRRSPPAPWRTPARGRRRSGAARFRCSETQAGTSSGGARRVCHHDDLRPPLARSRRSTGRQPSASARSSASPPSRSDAGEDAGGARSPPPARAPGRSSRSIRRSAYSRHASHSG